MTSPNVYVTTINTAEPIMCNRFDKDKPPAHECFKCCFFGPCEARRGSFDDKDADNDNATARA